MQIRTPIETGEIYHVINRGVDKRKIFMKTQDHLRFILGLYFFNDANTQNIWENLQYKKEDIHAILATPDLAKDPAKEFGDERERLVDLLAFTIMPNHYHLIIREIRARGLSQFMQKMGGYTLYFNQ